MIYHLQETEIMERTDYGRGIRDLWAIDGCVVQ